MGCIQGSGQTGMNRVFVQALLPLSSAIWIRTYGQSSGGRSNSASVKIPSGGIPLHMDCQNQPTSQARRIGDVRIVRHLELGDDRSAVVAVRVVYVEQPVVVIVGMESQAQQARLATAADRDG